jgi:hypothetical protein
MDCMRMPSSKSPEWGGPNKQGLLSRIHIGYRGPCLQTATLVFTTPTDCNAEYDNLGQKESCYGQAYLWKPEDFHNHS